MNAGLAGLTEGWALVANSDVQFEPGAVDELLAVAARWPRAATVGPAIRQGSVVSPACAGQR